MIDTQNDKSKDKEQPKLRIKNGRHEKQTVGNVDNIVLSNNRAPISNLKLHKIQPWVPIMIVSMFLPQINVKPLLGIPPQEKEEFFFQVNDCGGTLF